MSTSNPNSEPNPILAALTAALSSGPAQKLDDEVYKPRLQSYWRHNGSDWAEIVGRLSSEPAISVPISSEKLRLISWNIDILVPFAEERMRAALQYLEALVASTPASTPIVIFLQEMGISDLGQIRDAPWVQQHFHITERDERNWASPLYGTTTLVDRRLRIESVFRVRWISKFERDGLFVDVSVVQPRDADAPGHVKGDRKVLRLCNTHLESLVADPPVRPLQLQVAAEALHQGVVGAALLAGDLNAIQPFDRTLHEENGLQDAYLVRGGREDSDEGYTWGYQVPQPMRERFGCSRMDKILFRGDIKASWFERIGMGVRVEEEEVRERMREGEQDMEGWVTDHYGVLGDFELVGWVLE
ncbi:hypothetical protein K505DRAFT_278444 [Melanomma pulvis-pyrius CBS 109.77]|uniref:Endonuclease/exonuclease/phosphatase domain-containing protein n=1 Tax=Melanomma pulvis-pyrius CBS 109.77 TaxID=1314802 RepID=A0A6A6X987_9PLEO|nr:hypothetical protein K505DRAFT_278444 [Melanomma pulvis-pyrius CBS 109.77]